MNIRLLLAALGARFRILLLVTGVTVLAATVVSLLMAKTYVASTAVLIDNKSDQSLGKSSEINLREWAGYMQTQIDIITSRKVAGKVVDELDLANQMEARQAFSAETGGEGSIEDWLAGRLLKDLKASTTQSSVIRISYESVDAQFAARVANAFARAYMETALELRIEPSRKTALWFDEQMQGLRANLEQAQAQLTQYQKSRGIVDERYDNDNLALAELSAELARLQNRQAGVVLPVAILSPAAQSIRAELARAEGKLHELGSRLGSNHPTYQRQSADVSRLRARLQVESAGAGESGGQQEKRVAELRKAIDVVRGRILENKQYRNQVEVLGRNVDIAQKAYETALQHSLDKQVESRANLTNISLLHEAIAPFKPTKPRIALNIGLALVVGILLGLSVIYLMEMLDHRVRSQADLRDEFLIPVLAELSPLHAASGHLLGAPRHMPVLPNPG